MIILRRRYFSRVRNRHSARDQRWREAVRGGVRRLKFSLINNNDVAPSITHTSDGEIITQDSLSDDSLSPEENFVSKFKQLVNYKIDNFSARGGAYNADAQQDIINFLKINKEAATHNSEAILEFLEGLGKLVFTDYFDKIKTLLSEFKAELPENDEIPF